jgi:hypothetical protein
MASTNAKKTSTVFSDERLAGGMGQLAAKQSNLAAFKRTVLSCLLWEDNAYIDGESIAKNIAELIPTIHPSLVSQIAVQARYEQKLRHVPLFICREMAKHDSHKGFVANTLAEVINRPDELTEFLSLYWKDNGKKTLSAQVKRGLSSAFGKFNEYQLAKYNRKKEVCLRDVLRLVHPSPKNQEQSDLWKRLLSDSLATPDTWEVHLSKATSPEEKRSVWENLINTNKLGATAFLKNMRNMISVNVAPSLIRKGLASMNVEMLLPLDFFKAADYAKDYMREIEDAMYRCLASYKKLPGKSVFVVDVSGSMATQISNKSTFSRMDAGIAMAILASEMCESISVYATAGSDGLRTHSTQKIKPYRGFALGQEIRNKVRSLGGGGIFTRQCLEYIKTQEAEAPDRIIVFSDSQDCDFGNKKKPNPFGKRNYIVDVSSHKNGVNYQGVWTAELSGWSEAFLKYISYIEEELQK